MGREPARETLFAIGFGEQAGVEAVVEAVMSFMPERTRVTQSL